MSHLLKCHQLRNHISFLGPRPLPPFKKAHLWSDIEHVIRVPIALPRTQHSAQSIEITSYIMFVCVRVCISNAVGDSMKCICYIVLYVPASSERLFAAWMGVGSLSGVDAHLVLTFRGVRWGSEQEHSPCICGSQGTYIPGGWCCHIVDYWERIFSVAHFRRQPVMNRPDSQRCHGCCYS